MCIYCGTKKYRKIYENHYGPIPKDSDGRTYEIHHIDGNKLNNSPDNLRCVSIKEHYDIHYSQGDWAACLRMSHRMQLSPSKISELSRKCQTKLVENGTHHWLGPSSNLKRIVDGTNPFGNREWQKKKAEELVKNGKHNFLGGKIQSRNNLRRMANGTHPSQIMMTCPHCDKTMGSSNYKKYHGDRCLARPENANVIRTNNANYPSWKCKHCGKEGRGTHLYKRWHGDICKFKPS
jgi:hypothetical protein